MFVPGLADISPYRWATGQIVSHSKKAQVLLTHSQYRTTLRRSLGRRGHSNHPSDARFSLAYTKVTSGLLQSCM